MMRSPFKLSTRCTAELSFPEVSQELHMDYARDALGWTMTGFIFL